MFDMNPFYKINITVNSNALRFITRVHRESNF
jgi:hypothetical protein